MNFENEVLPKQEQKYETFDVCIVGGGIDGLSLGCQIAEKEPQQRIAILEPELTGASGSAKDPGFATYISFSQFADDCRRLGIGRATSAVKERLAGLRLMLQQVDWDPEIAQCTGSYEILTDKDFYLLNYLDQINSKLFELFNENVFELRNEHIGEFGMNKEVVRALVFHRLEWQVNPGKLLNALIRRFQRMGGAYLTGCQLLSYTETTCSRILNTFHGKEIMEEGKRVVLTVGCGSGRGEVVRIGCQLLVFCGSRRPPPPPKETATPQALLSLVMVTRPISGLSFETSFSLKHQECYVRTVNCRLLVVVSLAAPQRFEEQLTRQGTRAIAMLRLLFPAIQFEPDCVWMNKTPYGGDTESRAPALERLSPNVFCMAQSPKAGIGLNFVLAEKAFYALFRVRGRH